MPSSRLKDMPRPPREQMAGIFGPVNLVIPRLDAFRVFFLLFCHRPEHTHKYVDLDLDLPVLFKYLVQDIIHVTRDAAVYTARILR